MSFLKISDPVKRDLIVKEFLKLKKNIRDNLHSERTGEQQLQTDLSKFYKPITETQKATAREITEGLKPIREGIENLPQAITFPPTQPIGKEEEEENIGEIAKKYLNIPSSDTTFGIRDEKGLYCIGNMQALIFRNNIIIDDEKFEGTPGLWELITSKNPQDPIEYEDYKNYERLMEKTNALHRGYDPSSFIPKANKSKKWKNILGPIWHKRKGYRKETIFRASVDKSYRFLRESQKKKKEYEKRSSDPSKYHEGKGVVVIPSYPNALVERLDLLLASQKAGHTGVRNELVSICDELKRQGVLDTEAYKKINSIIKK